MVRSVLSFVVVWYCGQRRYPEGYGYSALSISRGHFFHGTHNGHTIARPSFFICYWWGICNIVLYCTAIYRESTVLSITNNNKAWTSVWFLGCIAALFMDNYGYALNHWEMTLHCNVISHWLSTYPEWCLTVGLPLKCRKLLVHVLLNLVTFNLGRHRRQGIFASF